LPFNKRSFKPNYRLVEVCHRRAGKTVGVVVYVGLRILFDNVFTTNGLDLLNEGIRDKYLELMRQEGLPLNTASSGDYIYLCPQKSQAFTNTVSAIEEYLSEFIVKDRKGGLFTLGRDKITREYRFFNGGRLILGSAQIGEKYRGGKYGGVIFDEFADIDDSVYVSLVPSVMDTNGFIVCMGTYKYSEGEDNLNKLLDYVKKRDEGEWDIIVAKLSESEVYDKGQQEIMQRDLGWIEGAYEQEFELDIEKMKRSKCYIDDRLIDKAEIYV